MCATTWCIYITLLKPLLIYRAVNFVVKQKVAISNQTCQLPNIVGRFPSSLIRVSSKGSAWKPISTTCKTDDYAWDLPLSAWGAKNERMKTEALAFTAYFTDWRTGKGMINDISLIIRTANFREVGRQSYFSSRCSEKTYARGTAFSVGNNTAKGSIS